MTTAPLTLVRVIDTETTGMGPEAQVCEIGWTDVRLYPGGWGIERGPISHLCGVTTSVEPAARAAHHITDEDLDGQPGFGAHLETLYAGVEAFAAHNAEFDGQFFMDKRVPWICSMKVAAALWPDAPGFGNQTLRYWRGIVFDDLAKTLPAHRAGPDSFVTAHVLVDLMNTIDAKTGARHPIEAFVKVSALPRRWLRIPIGKHRGLLMSEVPDDYLRWVVDRSELDETAKWNCRRELERR